MDVIACCAKNSGIDVKDANYEDEDWVAVSRCIGFTLDKAYNFDADVRERVRLVWNRSK